jgi:ATPase subunit of ABC transporter with duplicated ATPase domains
MTLLTIRGLAIASPRPLFTDLNLSINAGDRIGLIAGNGGGKTTLLRCLADLAEPTTGEITKRRGLRVAYVEQDVPENLLGLTLTDCIRRAIPPESRESDAWKIDLTLDMLQTPEDLRGRKLAELSGGWQRLALLARAWITDPDLLLLDEPTNHLDLQRLAVLEDWINHATEGVAMLIASHDRAFLDAVTTRTLFLRPDISRTYAHPFTRARDLLDADDAAHAAKLEKDVREAQRLRANAGRLKNVGINSGSDLLLKKAKYLNERAEAIEEAIKPPERVRTGEIRLSNRGTHARVLVSLDDVEVATPDGRPLFRTGKLKIFQRDRIVLRGANGTGKTRLVHLLRRALLDNEAIPGLTTSPSIVAFYLDQLMSQLPNEETAHGFITKTFRPGDQRAISLLASAGFDLQAQSRQIATLSPGQKARLGLLAGRLIDPNFYLLDEPTNHVDIAGQERLESEIVAHEATCVLVSHDRAFMAAIGTREWTIEGGRLVES